MSTKFTIKYGEQYHLYRDWLDECADLDVVNLRLTNVAFTCSSPGNIDVAIPRDVAEALGLIPKQEEPDDKSN